MDSHIKGLNEHLGVLGISPFLPLWSTDNHAELQVTRLKVQFPGKPINSTEFIYQLAVIHRTLIIVLVPYSSSVVFELPSIRSREVESARVFNLRTKIFPASWVSIRVNHRGRIWPGKHHSFIHLSHRVSPRHCRSDVPRGQAVT